MSYDLPDDYTPPPPQRFNARRWFAEHYWDFVIWAALDAPLGVVNRWGLRRLDGNVAGGVRIGKATADDHDCDDEDCQRCHHVGALASQKQG